MDKDFILFDLDGTLIDPKVGITKSVQYSLKTFGVNVENLYDLVSFIGPPLRDSYKEYFSFSDEEAEKAVEKYREYFTEKGIFENTMYIGIDGLLRTLYEQQKRLVIATSKPTVYAEKILINYKIDKYFTFISGSELDGRRSSKDLIIQYAFENTGGTELHKAIMVGDRRHDIIGAKQVGIDSIGVLYGYGNFTELTNAGADYIVNSVLELLELLS